MKLFTSCKEAAKAAAEALEHDLPFYRRFALGFHLLICSACRRYRRQVVGLNRLVRRYVRESNQPVVELDAATRQRFIARLRQVSGTPAGGTPATSGDGSSGGTSEPR
jgi:predicted anti-sigma-YlaC factor YlaD